MNKKGLINSVILIMGVMFIFAISSLLSITMWTQVTNTIDNIDNETISPHVKEKINNLSTRILWGDKLFVMFFVCLLISFIISSRKLPTEEPIFFLIFFGILVIVTIVAMGLSNGWTWIIGQSAFTSASQNLPFTNWFMKYLPIITFFIGIIGAVLFYSRKREVPNDTFE